MKKLFNVFITTLCACGLFAVLAPAVLASEPLERITCGTGTGRLTVHFAYFDETIPVDEIVFYSWGTTGKTAGDVFVKAIGEDSFGAYTDFCVTAGTAAPGVIALHTPIEFQEVDATNPYIITKAWDNSVKLTTDVITDTSTLVDGGQIDAYFFEDATTVRNALMAYSDKINVLVTYAAEDGFYEEKLGFHLWGSDWALGESIVINTAWGNPTMGILRVGATNSLGATVLVGMLYATGSAGGSGGLIYAGDDATKKAGADATPKVEIGISGYEIGNTYQYAGIDKENYAGVQAVLNAAVAFMPQEIHLVDYNISEEGTLAGTYAKSKTVVYVETSLEMADDADISVFQGTTKLVIKEKSVNKKIAVLILEQPLDITKEYKVYYVEGEGDEKIESELILNLDTEAPVITFLNYTKPIEIKLGSKWAANQSKFPQYEATDNRDGDLTVKVYVPSGDKSILNTKKAGTYTILLQVEDSFGNIGTKEFQFIVK